MEMGSVNVSKITKYLLRYGWQTFVLTKLRDKAFPSLPLEIPKEYVFYVPSLVGWYLPAFKEGLKLIHQYKPNIIFASSPSHVAQVVAFMLSLFTGIPWIAHLRDPWTVDPYYNKAKLTLPIGKLMERVIFKTASAIIVVSEGYADFYRKISRRPVFLIHNGFDPEDFPKDAEQYPRFELFYAGRLYEGRRDTTPLLQAVSELKREGYFERFPLEIVFHLVPSEIAFLKKFVEIYEIGDIVRLRPWMEHKFIIQEECKSTYLLLPLWRSPRDRFTYTGKLFEYMGARRPILCLSNKENLAARMVESLGIGVVCETKEEVKTFLKGALRKFYTQGGIGKLPEDKVLRFSWANQVGKIAKILEKWALKQNKK